MMGGSLQTVPREAPEDLSSRGFLFAGSAWQGPGGSEVGSVCVYVCVPMHQELVFVASLS